LSGRRITLNEKGLTSVEKSTRVWLGLVGLSLLGASGLVLAAPAGAAFADGSCAWGSGGSARTFGVGAQVVVNGLQFNCNPSLDNSAPFWNLQGHTSADDTQGLDGMLSGQDPSNFSDGAALLSDENEMFTSGGGSWNDSGSYDDWTRSSGDTGGPGGPDTLLP
jgi:hypothetical protein